MGFHARQAAASDLRVTSPSYATRSGWASVQSHQASWRGWKRMWLLLKEELHILDWESSESLEISLTSVSWLQALEYDGAQHCCLLVAGSLEYYISFWSERELFEWIDDISQWTSLNGTWQDSVTQVESPDVSASFLTSPDIGTTSLPSLQINDLPHQEPQIVSSPEENDGLEWREEILSEYFDAPKSPMSFTFISTPLKLVRKRACKRKGSEGRSQDKPMPSHRPNPSWTVNKHKLYQNLLSLLVLVTTVDSLRQDDRMLDVMRELFKSIEALDTVTTFLGQPEWLRDVPWETRKKDEADLVTLLRAISTSKSGFKAVLGLRGESAQQFLDMAHEILHFPSLQRSEDKRFGIKLLKVMIRLSEICHILPSSLFLAGVDVLGNDATYWGSFSNVYRASYLGQTVALKRMRVFESDAEAAQFKIRQKFCREALVWQHLKHPNVLPFIGIDPENFESLCIVSPWMENGTALSYLKLNGYNDVDIMLYGIGQGLAYLHSLEVIHGDLRGANILVDDDGNARIADFGLAVLTDMSTQTSSTYPGSVRWMAPELLYPASQGYDKFQRTRSSDVYSFACVCVELYTGLVPFSDIRYDATVALKVVAGERPGRPTWDDGPRKGRMPSALWTLVQSCWSQVCNQRPSVTTIIKQISVPKGCFLSHSLIFDALSSPFVTYSSPSAFTIRVVRCGWALVKSRGPFSSWRGWSKKWLHLTPTTLKIYNKSSSNYTQIDLNFATRIERVESSKSQWCFCIDALGPRVCISLRSDKELNEWMNDVYLSSSLSSRCTMPLSVVHHVHCQEDPKSGRLVGLPAEWRAHLLLESLPARSSTLSVNVVGLHPPPGGLFSSHARSKSDGDLDAVNGSLGHRSHIGRKLKCLRWAESSDDAAESLYEAYGSRTESIVARKQRIYQNFFALLLEEISVDSSYAKQRALLRLQELFRSVAALDCVSSLLESSDYRDELLDIWREVGDISDQRVYDALEKDEGELLRLLQAVAVSTSATEMVLSLRGRRAQQFMDIVQDVLSYPNPQQPTSTQLRLCLLHLVTKLSQYCGYQPASLSISDVSCDASEPRFSGSFGDVFLASLHGVPVALKRMRPIWTSLNPDDIEAMRQKHCREALIWQHLSHPNLLTFIGIDNKTFHPTPCLVSPWMENGTVVSYLRKHQGVNVAQLLFEVAQGLEYLHFMKVCHGDLRGSNVLVDNDGHARIADFGLVPLYALTSAAEYSGSLRWTAPEVIRSKIHGKRRLKRMPVGDIYSFGCLCVELYSLQPPFDGLSEVNAVMLVLDGIPPPRPVEMEDEMWTLVQDCLCPDFCNRPRASALVGRMGATKTSSI